MSLSLLLPLGLIALGGLSVPLLIHLVRQSDNQVIDFPALRWLRESVRPRRRLRFEDLWLLLARLLLVGLAALLVSMPILDGIWRGPRHWIAVMPGLDIHQARQKISDGQAEWHWLAAGFPAIDKSVPEVPSTLSSLLRELDAEMPNDDTLSVIVPTEVQGLDAQRIMLGRPIDWIVLPAQSDSVPPPAKPTDHVLAVRHATEHGEGTHYLRAAIDAWSADESTRWTIDDQVATAALPAATDALIWLDSPLPDSVDAWIRKGGRALVIDDASAQGSELWRDESGVVLAADEIRGNGHLIHLRGPLTTATMPVVLDADFPARLQTLLTPALPPPSWTDAVGIEPRVSVQPLPRFAQSTELAGWIGLLIGFVFLVERGLATRRRLS